MIAQNFNSTTGTTSTAAQSSLTKGSVWRDEGNYLTITNIEGDIVEYGYAHRRDVFYLTRSNFQRNFSSIPKGYTFSKGERDTLMDQLRTCLKEVKSKNLGDHVYFKMDELGL